MWLRLFRWRIIIGRCWNEVYREEVVEVYVYRWSGMRKF